MVLSCHENVHRILEPMLPVGAKVQGPMVATPPRTSSPEGKKMASASLMGGESRLLAPQMFHPKNCDRLVGDKAASYDKRFIPLPPSTI